MKNSWICPIGVLAVVLCGCGDGIFVVPGDPVDFDSPAAALAAFDTRLTEHATLANSVIGSSANGIVGLISTPDNLVPTTGTVAFNGSSNSIIPRANAPTISAVGDASLAANFATGEIAGTVTNITAANSTSFGSPVAALSSSGTLALSTGTLNNFENNLISIDYTGDLMIDGVTYEMDGTLLGDLRSSADTTPVAASALAVSDIARATVVGDETVNVTTVLVAEQ